jgi:hypothetical protein
LFTPKNEDLRSKIAFEVESSGVPPHLLQARWGHSESQKWDLDQPRAQLGKDDGFVLTGEAYVPRLIHGKLMEGESEVIRMKII